MKVYKDPDLYQKMQDAGITITLKGNKYNPKLTIVWDTIYTKTSGRTRGRTPRRTKTKK